MSRRVESLKIQKFDPKRYKQTHKSVFIGKSGSGKTVLLKHIMSQFTDVPVGCVISQTEFVNRTYSEFVPSCFIHDEYSPAIIEKALKRQFTMCKKEKDLEMERGVGNSGVDPRAFLILDDCLSSKQEMINDKHIKYIFFASRHVKLTFMMAMQYPLGLTPDLRGNIDFVFLFRESNVQNRKRIYENYAGMFPDMGTFEQVMDQCTENFGCLVIDNTVRTNKLQDQIFWYRCEDNQPPFRLCDPSFWVDNKPFRSTLAIANGDDEYDPTANRSARKGPIIRVKKF